MGKNDWILIGLMYIKLVTRCILVANSWHFRDYFGVRQMKFGVSGSLHYDRLVILFNAHIDFSKYVHDSYRCLYVWVDLQVLLGFSDILFIIFAFRSVYFLLNTLWYVLLLASHLIGHLKEKFWCLSIQYILRVVAWQMIIFTLRW